MNNKQSHSGSSLKSLLFLSVILSFVLLLTFTTIDQAEASQQQIHVKVDGEAVDFDTKPVIHHGRVLVPIRPIIEAMAAKADWDTNEEVVRISMDGASLTIPSDYRYVQTVKGNQSSIVRIDVPANIIDGRTMVPLRIIGESFGYRVDWNESTSTVSYTKSGPASSNFKRYKIEGSIENLHPYELDVFWLVNQNRSSAQLQPLALHVDLSLVAREKSKDMLNNDYFSHTSPTYGSPFDMMRSSDISFRAAGENIAAGYSSPVHVMEGWMNSDGHRANILSQNYTFIGVGFVSDSTGDKTYWTQMFMTP